MGDQRRNLVARRTVLDAAPQLAAMAQGDPARARKLIIEHTEQVRQLVRDVIDRAGGAL